jgi:hypothetical protein
MYPADGSLGGRPVRWIGAQAGRDELLADGADLLPLRFGEASVKLRGHGYLPLTCPLPL